MKKLAEAVHKRMIYELTGTRLEEIHVYVSMDNIDDFLAELCQLINRQNNSKLETLDQIVRQYRTNPDFPKLHILRGTFTSKRYNYIQYEHWKPSAIYTDAALSYKKAEVMCNKTGALCIIGAITFGLALNYIIG